MPSLREYRRLVEYLKKHDVACPKCRYNLRGLTEGKCPECGFYFDLDGLLDLHAVARPRWHRLFGTEGWWALVLVNVGLILWSHSLTGPVPVLAAIVIGQYGIGLGRVLLLLLIIAWIKMRFVGEVMKWLDPFGDNEKNVLIAIAMCTVLHALAVIAYAVL